MTFKIPDPAYIPAPYTDYRNAWRAAYVSIYGKIEDDTDLLTSFKEQRKAVWDAEAAQFEKHLENWDRYKPASSLADGMSNKPAPAKPTLPAAPIDDFEVDTDPCHYFFPITIDLTPLSERRPESTVFTPRPPVYLPSDRFRTARDAILGKLFQGTISGYTIVSEVVKFAPETMWANSLWVTPRCRAFSRRSASNREGIGRRSNNRRTVDSGPAIREYVRRCGSGVLFRRYQ